ncbi:MAG TPA: plastocyanin/azurin family copper-binding protein [Rubricoccaceae bacterium]|jgi:azurin
MRVLITAVCLTFAACSSEPAPPDPAQSAVFAEAVDTELVVAAQANAMAYATARIEAPAGATVRLVMDNTGTSSPTMLHNVVVLKAAGDIDRVGRAAAGDADHIPNDASVIAATPIAGPGERTAVVFTMPPAGSYPFICTYPGHFQFMQGTLVSTPAGA